jgi:hypothetical protein
MHSGKTPKHSGKASLSATLGKGLPGKPFTGKRPSPSVILALGEDLTLSVPSAVFKKKLIPECNTRGRNLIFFKKNLFPECLSSALGEELWLLFIKTLFPECFS